jgi:hypothetical protein
MSDNVSRYRRVHRGGVRPGSQRGELQRWRAAARRALVSGSSAAVTSAVALSICSRMDEGSYVGGLNGPSQWLWGEHEAYTRRLTLRHSVIGYVIHHLTSIFWATIFERIFGEPGSRKRALRRGAEAAISTTGAYVVDYYLTPSRFRPGFKKHVRTPSMFVIYGAFALGLAVAAIARDRRS